jgi:predicted Zn-dependent peptidase
LKQIIEGKIDNKAQYAFTRCIEEMYKNKPYGLYKYGYVEDLNNINSENLYNQYTNLIQTCKIDIFVSGKINNELQNIIKENENIKKLKDREPNYITKSETADIEKDIKTIEEKMEISQGKLVIGLNLAEDTKESRYIATVYNAILGGTPTSKMFQNVREKASLAYTASSSYVKNKNNIFIRCGIEVKNYEKAVELIKKQIEEIKNGNFTDDEINSAKTNITATIKSIPDEQDTEISYYFGQEISEIKMNFEEYENSINSVSKQDIIDFANKVSVNIIYFLRGN